MLFISVIFFLRPPLPENRLPESLSTIVFIFLLQIPFFYFNAYYLIPRFLYRGKVALYLILVLSGGIIASTIHYFSRIYWFPMQGPMPLRWHLIDMPIIVMWTISTSFRLLLDNFRKEQERKEQETERLKSELSFLRSQISPHFMFNVLNSIVALARKKPEKVEPVVIQLSELMRYMLYESDETQVLLDKEISYLKSYVDLQRLRFGDSIDIQFFTEHTDPNLLIEPMLLIPFVENAFKHGTGLITNPVIEIRTSTHAETFRFQVRNRVNAIFLEEKDNSSGIGLTNVERRLKLLYPDAHELHVNHTRDWYEVNLTLQLKKEANRTQSKPLLSPRSA